MLKPSPRLITHEKIGPYSYDEYQNCVISFHGFVSPGVLLGGFMVDLALHTMPAGILFDALCETGHCLPDAVQLLTPCTTGNGWLRVIDLGRFALSLYDKKEGHGFRVFIDPAKLDPWSRIKSWLFKLEKKAEQDTDGLLNEIRQAGPAIASVEPVRLRPPFLLKDHRGAISLCPACGEPYPIRDGKSCQACRGRSPYVSQGAAGREGQKKIVTPHLPYPRPGTREAQFSR
jgi:formylmethanofuran dehydrogenase subunit E